MANRHTLHVKHKDLFIEWLKNDGWTIENPKGDYEVIRARKAKRMVIVYDRLDMKEHYTVRDTDTGVLGAFLRDLKGRSVHDEATS